MPAEATTLNKKHLIEDMGLSYFLSSYRGLLCKIDDTYYRVAGVTDKPFGDLVEAWHYDTNTLTVPGSQGRNAPEVPKEVYLYNFTTPGTSYLGSILFLNDISILRPTNTQNLQALLEVAEDDLEIHDGNEPQRFDTYEDDDGDTIEDEETCDEWWDWDSAKTTLLVKVKYYEDFLEYIELNGGPRGIPEGQESTEEAVPEEDQNLEKLWIVCQKIQSTVEYAYVHVSKLTSLAQFPRLRKEINLPEVKSVTCFHYKTRGIEVTSTMLRNKESFLNPTYPTDLKEVIRNMRGETEGPYTGWQSVVMDSGLKVQLMPDYNTAKTQRTYSIEVSLEGTRLALISPEGKLTVTTKAFYKHLQ